eukprot:5278273-Lingulodinium_polyedra.AAC.1
MAAFRPVRFSHVYGHVGNVGNELADTLAAVGAEGVVAADNARPRWPRAAECEVAMPRGTIEV